MQARIYLLTAALTILVLTLATVAFTIVVDPYRMFDTAQVAGWNEMKPRVYSQANLAKTYQLERIAPKTLLLGNSRVEVGFDPESEHWPESARPVFNGGQAGTDLFTSWALLRDAVAVKPPRTVIIGLDIIDFLQPAKDRRIEFPKDIADRMLVDDEGRTNPLRANQRRKDLLASTLTIDALLDSFTTVLSQHPSESATMTPYGFNPLKETNAYIRRSGQYGHFAEKTTSYEKQFARFTAQDFANPEAVANFRALDEILNVARDKHIRVVLFIHPYHAQFMDVMQKVGLTSTFARWKDVLASYAAARATGQALTLVDFSEPSDITREAVPPPDDLRTVMQWYWEAGHYKAALGDKMIPRLMGEETTFGKVLNTPAQQVAKN